MTEEQRKLWNDWLSERPDNVRVVAEKFVPFKRYIYKRSPEDTGNRYTPISFEEKEDGSVTVTCYKENDEMPILGGYNVFGINPDDLEEEHLTVEL